MTTDSMRKTAFAAGGLYLLTFITSIPALILKGPVMDNADFVLGNGSEAGLMWAGFLDIALALACVGTALALYPVTKRYSQTAALGFVTSRLLEAAIIVVGIMCLFSVLTLRQDASGADAGALVTTGQSLVAMHDWSFLFGPGLMASVNAMFLGTVMYRSRLVPRAIPIMGLIGAPLLLASTVATMFGAWGQLSPVASVATLPVALWEVSLGIWLVTKGFKSTPAAPLSTGQPVFAGVA